MAKITSKSLLNVGTELVINEPARTIQLVATGNLVAKDGVTWQALYSKIVDLWATASYQDSPMPFYAIDALSGQFQIGTDGATFSGWNFDSDTTRNMLRDGGWAEYNSGGTKTAEYVGAVGLGSITPVTTCQPYYHLASTDAPINFPFTDQFNVGVKVYDNVSLDKRTYFKAFIREYGKKFKSSVLADTGSSGTGPFKQNFLVSNEDDLKLTTLLGSDATAADAAMAGAPYSGITVAYYSANQTRTIAGVSRNFKIIIEGNGGTLEQIYAKVQYLLRQNADINTGGTAGTKTGKIQDELLRFVGDTLVTSQSVYIDDVLSADSNRVEFYDDSNTLRVNNYTASGAMAFNSVLVGAGSSYRLIYTTTPGGDDYGEATAITVNNAAGTPITGTISSGSISFDFDWNGNTQGGFSGGTVRDVTLIGIRPGYGKFAVATGQITQSKSIALSLVAEADRVYA
ncbi:MAG: hypothetical protein IPL32_17800 [Chloracidobacterium sp.]|nr:hypothetical protein [Chloracidobacterium sp.]